MKILRACLQTCRLMLFSYVIKILLKTIFENSGCVPGAVCGIVDTNMNKTIPFGHNGSGERGDR